MQRILVTGGSGFIGRRVVEKLCARGDLVTVLTRDVPRARKHLPGAVRVAAWTPEKEGPWVEELGIVDAVVHLAGEPVARRWSDNAKRSIEKSRIASTHILTEAIGGAKHKPRVLVSASAIGYYGPRPPDEKLTEESAPGKDFLARVTEKWEEEARAAEAHGVRVVSLRIGVVFGPGGGALEKLVQPYKFFLGGPIGRGEQVISWVHRDDVVGMILFAIDHAEAKGPINAVSPNPVTSQELAEALGAVLGRPAWFRTPKGLISLVMGEAAEILTTGQRVFPARAVELGYEFHHARLVPALESILAPSS